MDSPNSEDLEFLRTLRGRYGAFKIWPTAFEFTSKEIIEWSGRRIKKKIRIVDIVEFKVVAVPNRMILKTADTEMKILIPDKSSSLAGETPEV
jgi:hypothetical protein